MVVIVWIGIVFVPDAVNPDMPAVAVAVQEKVVVGGLGFEVKVTNVVCEPEQIVWLKLVFVIMGAVFTENDCVAVFDAPHSLVTISDTV